MVHGHIHPDDFGAGDRAERARHHGYRHPEQIQIGDRGAGLITCAVVDQPVVVADAGEIGTW